MTDQRSEENKAIVLRLYDAFNAATLTRWTHSWRRTWSTTTPWNRSP